MVGAIVVRGLASTSNGAHSAALRAARGVERITNWSANACTLISVYFE